MQPTQVHLEYDAEATSTSFWSPPYSRYQQFLFQTITDRREQGWTYKGISDWLIERNHLTPRGKRFSDRHVWSILKKGLIHADRVGHDPVVDVMNIDLHYDHG
ncbi:recombinase family protein [Magnetovibrio blakemorei]|uniref:recombinase family protein n=1 Tax=Magnetovibrio blakemorei TaxID=28181 RepID=UPI00389964B0